MSPRGTGERLAHLRAQFAARGIRPLRSRGQHFLLDPNLLAALCRDADLGAQDLVLEVGAGSGWLTEAMLAAGVRVVAVEVDRGLAALVREAVGAHPRCELVEADILAGKHRLDERVLGALDRWAADAPHARLKTVSNLPYSVASPFVANLCADPRAWSTAVLMVQQEVAERLTAAPGGRSYGTLSVAVRLACDRVERVRTVPARVFWPRPQVESAVVRLHVLCARARAAVPWAAVREVAGAVFRARRKTLRNALRGLVSDEPARTLDARLADLGLDPGARGEGLAPEDFLRLARAFASDDPSALPPGGG